MSEKQFNTVVGDRLRTARKRVGLSQWAVAEAMDLTQSAMSFYESGNRPVPTHLLIRLATLYNQPWHEFVPTGDDNPPIVLSRDSRLGKIVEQVGERSDLLGDLERLWDYSQWQRTQAAS